MNYVFTETQINKIIKQWGQEFYSEILCDIKIYSEKWGLSDFEFVEHYSISAIFFCKSEIHGDSVLKIGASQYNELQNEYNFLCEYNDRCFVKVFEYDIKNNIMLIERVTPGAELIYEEPSLEDRLFIFSELFNGLHIEPKKTEIYDFYINWVCDLADYMKTREDSKELYSHILKMEEIYFEISKTYNKKMLLHGDMHYANILLSNNGKYKIIDPKGVIGDPVTDAGRFILNEYWWRDKSANHFDTISKVTQYLEKSLNIPDNILRQCFYIDMVMVNGWGVKNNGTANLDDIKFAEDIMNKGN